MKHEELINKQDSTTSGHLVVYSLPKRVGVLALILIGLAL